MAPARGSLANRPGRCTACSFADAWRLAAEPYPRPTAPRAAPAARACPTPASRAPACLSASLGMALAHGARGWRWRTLLACADRLRDHIFNGFPLHGRPKTIRGMSAHARARARRPSSLHPAAAPSPPAMQVPPRHKLSARARDEVLAIKLTEESLIRALMQASGAAPLPPAHASHARNFKPAPKPVKPSVYQTGGGPNPNPPPPPHPPTHPNTHHQPPHCAMASTPRHLPTTLPSRTPTSPPDLCLPAPPIPTLFRASPTPPHPPTLFPLRRHARSCATQPTPPVCPTPPTSSLRPPPWARA